MDLKKLRKDAIVKFMDHIKDRQLKYGEKDAFRFIPSRTEKVFIRQNILIPIELKQCPERKKRKPEMQQLPS